MARYARGESLGIAAIFLVVAFIGVSALPGAASDDLPGACGVDWIPDQDPLSAPLPNVINYPVSNLAVDIPDANHLQGWARGDLLVTSTVPLTIDGALFTSAQSGGSITIVAPSLHVSSEGLIATASRLTTLSVAQDSGTRTGLVWHDVSVELMQTLSAGSISLDATSIQADAGSCIATGNGGEGASTGYHFEAAVGTDGVPGLLEAWIDVGPEGIEGNVSYACIPLITEYPCFVDLGPLPTETLCTVLCPAAPVVSGTGGSGGNIMATASAIAIEGTVVAGGGGNGGSLGVDFTPMGQPVPNLVISAGSGGNGGLVSLVGASTIDLRGTVRSGQAGAGGTAVMSAPVPATLPPASPGSGGHGGAIILASAALNNSGTLATGAGANGGGLSYARIVTTFSGGGVAGAAGDINVNAPTMNMAGFVTTGSGGDGGSSVLNGGAAPGLSGGSGSHGGNLVFAASPLPTSLSALLSVGNGGHGGVAAMCIGSVAQSSSVAIGGQGGDSGFLYATQLAANSVPINPLPWIGNIDLSSGWGGRGGTSMNGCDSSHICQYDVQGLLCGANGEMEMMTYETCPTTPPNTWTTRASDGAQGDPNSILNDGKAGSSGEDGHDGRAGQNAKAGSPGDFAQWGGDGLLYGGNGGNAVAVGQCGGHGTVGQDGGNGGPPGSPPSTFDPIARNGDGGPGGRGGNGGDGGFAAASAGGGGRGYVFRGGDGGAAAATGGAGGTGKLGGFGGGGELGGYGGNGGYGGTSLPGSAEGGAGGIGGLDGGNGGSAMASSLTAGDAGDGGNGGAAMGQDSDAGIPGNGGNRLSGYGTAGGADATGGSGGECMVCSRGGSGGGATASGGTGGFGGRGGYSDGELSRGVWGCGGPALLSTSEGGPGGRSWSNPTGIGDPGYAAPPSQGTHGSRGTGTPNAQCPEGA